MPSQLTAVAILILFALAFPACQSSAPEWQSQNQNLIREYGLTERDLPNLPEPIIEPNLEPAEVSNLDDLPAFELHPGVDARLFWGDGTLTALLELQPGAEVPDATLPADRFVLVLEGTADQQMDGSTVTLTSRKREEQDGTHSATPGADLVYLEKGTRSALTAGPAGASLLEVYSPFRLDYLRKAGLSGLPEEMKDVEAALQPNVEPGRVYDLYDIPLTKLAEGVFTRLLSGRNMQLSFVSLGPGAASPPHIHPEEQTMLVLRGAADAILLDEKKAMAAHDVVRVPGNMVHGAEIGELGFDALDIFWPARTDYLEKEKASRSAFHAIIPEDAKLELVVDGKKTRPELTFAEGPKWMDGKIYFSNMYFDQDWNGDPSRSSIVELDPDGSYRNISQGEMQTNGLYPYKNGNLLVCDMMGHRVLEMTTEGRVVRVLVDQYDGKPIDGPNDIITDAKGGIYFTDPQFTMEAEKFQPGRAVYYRSPEGGLTRLTEPNEFAMPNGILLSPDGRTLYINNCFDDESWYPVDSEKDNFIWAFDVQEDGSIRNGRPFAEVFLAGNVLDRKGRSSGADGMAIDQEGNIYVATYNGVQIFDDQGAFIGMINLPSFPVSLCFGDPDMKTLYIVSYSKVFKIRTNMEGYVNYL